MGFTGFWGVFDSAFSAALLTNALGADKVLAVNMPTEHNAITTRRLAKQCARALGIEYRVVPIQSLYEEQLATLMRARFEPSTLVKENIQARIRAQQLAAIAQCVGGVFVNNGNKTEVALNYFTLNGDSAGAAAFLGDLWKSQVYEMARFINEQSRIHFGCAFIPEEILELVPSAELSAEQNVDEGKGDPIRYAYHDNLLRMFTERRWDPTKVLQSALAGTLEKDIGCALGVLEKYFPDRDTFVRDLEWAWCQYSAEFKRVQLPPVFLASRRAFGFDRRDTLADAHFSRQYCRLRNRFLEFP